MMMITINKPHLPHGKGHSPTWKIKNNNSSTDLCILPTLVGWQKAPASQPRQRGDEHTQRGDPQEKLIAA